MDSGEEDYLNQMALKLRVAYIIAFVKLNSTVRLIKISNRKGVEFFTGFSCGGKKVS